MQNVIAPPEPKTQVIELPFTEVSSMEQEAIKIGGSTYGCGTPHPATPLSQRRYDGNCPYEDGEPWL